MERGRVTVYLHRAGLSLAAFAALELILWLAL